MGFSPLRPRGRSDRQLTAIQGDCVVVNTEPDLMIERWAWFYWSSKARAEKAKVCRVRKQNSNLQYTQCQKPLNDLQFQRHFVHVFFVSVCLSCMVCALISAFVREIFVYLDCLLGVLSFWHEVRQISETPLPSPTFYLGCPTLTFRVAY